MKRKVSVIATLCLFAIVAVIGVTAQPGGTTIAINWNVPGVVSAQTLATQYVAFVATQTLGANSSAASAYNQACSDWTINAMRYRDLGMTQQPKPAQPPALHFVPTITGTNPITITVTNTVGPDLIGRPCADLPPPPVASPNNFVLGVAQSTPGFYSAGPGDTEPNNAVVTDPATGKRYQKIMLPWGGLYLLLN